MVSITAIFLSSKRKCIFTQLIDLLPNASITSAFFITFYYLQSLCEKLLYQLLSTQDFQRIQPQLNQLPLLPTVSEDEWKCLDGILLSTFNDGVMQGPY